MHVLRIVTWSILVWIYNFQESFWILVRLLRGERHKMRFLYLEGLRLTMQYMSIFEKLLQHFEPALAAHLEHEGVPISSFRCASHTYMCHIFEKSQQQQRPFKSFAYHDFFLNIVLHPLYYIYKWSLLKLYFNFCITRQISYLWMWNTIRFNFSNTYLLFFVFFSIFLKFPNGVFTPSFCNNHDIRFNAVLQ